MMRNLYPATGSHLSCQELQRNTMILFSRCRRQASTFHFLQVRLPISLGISIMAGLDFLQLTLTVTHLQLSDNSEFRIQNAEMQKCRWRASLTRAPLSPAISPNQGKGGIVIDFINNFYTFR